MPTKAERKRYTLKIEGTTAILHLALVVIVALSLFRFMGLTASPVFWGGLVGLFIIAGLLTRWSRMTLHLAAVGMGIVSILGIITHITQPETLDGIAHHIARWIAFLQAGYWGTLTDLPFDLAYASIGVFLIPLTFWGWNRLHRRQAWPVLIPGLVWLIIQWFFHFDSEPFVQYFLVVGLLLIAVNQGRDWYQRQDVTILEEFRLGSSLRAALVLSLGIMLLTGLAPDPQEPWDLPAMRDWFLDRFPTLDQLRGTAGRVGTESGWFSLSRSGYGPSTRLGGPVTLDETAAFAIRFSVRGVQPDTLPFPLYLQGRTMTRYTGEGWRPAREERWDWYDTNQLMPGMGPRDVDSIRLVKEIEPNDLISNTLFGMGDLRQVDPKDNDPATDGVIGRNRFGDAILRGGVVQSSYQVVSQLPFWDLKGDTPSEAGPAPDDVDIFLELPDTLPDRVVELADSITEDATGNFEKAQAVVKHLREYPYSLETRHVPPDRDFVDHFLFDEQAGYCTYHSSALAVLLRTQGIPTRWVQGYVLRQDDVEEQTDGPNPFWEGEVSQATAHAWVEVWIPAFGWVPFEATPNFDPIDHGRHLDRDALDLPEGEDDPTDRENDWTFGDSYDEPPWLADEAGLYDDPEPPSPWPRVFQITGITLLLILSGGGVFVWRYAHVQEQHLKVQAIRQLLPDDQNKTEAADIVGLTALAFQKIHDAYAIPMSGQTPRDFLRKLKEHAPETAEYLAPLVRSYEATTFGGETLDLDQADALRDAFEALKRHIRNEQGYWGYIRTRYLRPLRRNGITGRHHRRQ